MTVHVGERGRHSKSMGCNLSTAAVHPAPNLQATHVDDAADIGREEIVALQARVVELQCLLSNRSEATVGSRSREDELREQVATLQVQLVHAQSEAAELKAEVATLRRSLHEQSAVRNSSDKHEPAAGVSADTLGPTATAEQVQDQVSQLEEELAEHWRTLKEHEEALCRARCEASSQHAKPSSSTAVVTEPLEAHDLVRGMQLHSEVLAGMVQGLGLKGLTDPADVAVVLRELGDKGVEKMFRQHCVPRLIASFARSISAELRTDGCETVSSANSRYADDVQSFKAKLGNINMYEKGFTYFNGKPYPDDVLAQMEKEFADDEEFTTSNYGGITTTLRIEWEFVVQPVEGKVYPGEIGLQRGDHTFYPGRNRKHIDSLMKLATRSVVDVLSCRARALPGPIYLYAIAF